MHGIQMVKMFIRSMHVLIIDFIVTGFDGSYCPDCYTAPTDGVCRDKSCFCYNNIKEWEIILSLLIMIIGIIIAILLLILNFYYRNNK